MANALRELLAYFSIDVDSKPLDDADKKVDSFSSKLTEFGKNVAKWFAVGALIHFGENILQDADATAKAAQALGLAGQELQELEHAAGLSGVATEELRAALSRLQKGAAETANKGTGPVADAYKKLGVSIKNQDGTLRSSADIFQDVADGIASIENPTEKAGVASALFGKSYAKLIPLLDEGGDGIQKLRDEVQALGFGFDEAFLENAQEVNDNIDRLKLGIKGFGVQALAIVLPYLVQFTQRGVQLVRSIVKWTRESNILKAAMIALSAKGLIMLSRFLGPLGGRLIMLSRVMKTFALRILLPILLIDDLVTAFQGGDSVIGRFIDRLFGVGTTQKVVEALKDVWTTFIQDVLPMVGPVLEDVKGWFTGAGQWVMDQLSALRDWAHAVWEALPGPLQDILDMIGGMFAAVFDWIGNKITELINKFNPLKGLLDDLVDVSDAKANADARARRTAEDARAAAPGVAEGLRKFGAKPNAAISAPGKAGGASAINSVVNNHVTVPPGTPQSLAGDVARATGKATQNSNRATLAAVGGPG